MQRRNHRPLLFSGLVLLSCVLVVLAGTAHSQTGTSSPGGTTTYSSIGSTSYTTGHWSTTTTTSTSSHTTYEGFESSSGPYHVASSNATVLFASNQAASGGRSLSINCTRPCYADLWFDLEGWLTYSAEIQYLLLPMNASGRLDAQVGSRSSWTMPGETAEWQRLSHYAGECVQAVHFTWSSATAGTLFLDEVRIERSTTTQSPTPHGNASCGGQATTDGPCPTSYTATYAHCRPIPTTTMGYCKYPPPTDTSTCHPTTPSPTRTACAYENGTPVECPTTPSGPGTVTITKVAIPQMTGWATLLVLASAAMMAMKKRR